MNGFTRDGTNRPGLIRSPGRWQKDNTGRNIYDPYDPITLTMLMQRYLLNLRNVERESCTNPFNPGNHLSGRQDEGNYAERYRCQIRKSLPFPTAKLYPDRMKYRHHWYRVCEKCQTGSRRRCADPVEGRQRNLRRHRDQDCRHFHYHCSCSGCRAGLDPAEDDAGDDRDAR